MKNSEFDLFFAGRQASVSPKACAPGMTARRGFLGFLQDCEGDLLSFGPPPMPR
jgi:hypothetical protein